jgi:hypothetical protein
VTSRSSRIGGDTVGEVLVNGRVALRIREPAGGLTPAERAEIVARRMQMMANDGALDAGNLTVRQVQGVAGVYSDERLVVTADRRHAAANATSPLRLADRWQENLAAALDGRAPSYRRDTVSRRQRPIIAPELATKIVPIVTIGSAGSVGAAQVSGPENRVREVRAVVSLATDYRDRARIRLLVPIHTENVVSDLRRVPQVAVTGVAGLRF